MAFFDAYIMVDWSGGDRRRAGKQDCIWIAYGAADDVAPVTLSPPSRTEAEYCITSVLETVLASNNRRVLLSADFGYGYPAGFASLLPPPTAPGDLPPWRRVWQYLRKHMHDDIGTKPGRQPTNRSNRFEVASAINAIASTTAAPGPFWCLFNSGRYACVPQKRPAQPFDTAKGPIAARRLTDERARSDTPFRLFGTGSVGSQVLTGIPRLERIRFESRFAGCSAVWPFETGWAPPIGRWLAPDIRVLHAEIYPSVRAPLADSIKDKGQVRSMWHWARDLDRQNLFLREFEIPAGIMRESREDATIRSEEGWILGCRR